MNGVHDLGGMQSFGPVQPEPDEPPFHEDWERRTLAVTLAMGALGLWNIDQMRHERESLPPADLVVPVPDSGVPAALGFAEESRLPFDLGIIRNHYVGRTFIEPGQEIRDLGDWFAARLADG